MIRTLLILTLAYITTSFQVVNDRSISFLAGNDEVENDLTYVPHQYAVHTVRLQAGNTYHIDLGQKYTAIKITTLDQSTPEIDFSSPADTLNFGIVDKDENIDIPPSFAVFTSPTQFIKLKSDIHSQVKIELFFAPKVSITNANLKTKKNDCDKPSTIPQSSWRQGLALPKEGRNATVVKHCVIHHSAGNNNDTDYVNIIRNIYLLHTESNGWDDIGYNFVIAPNGTIFSGRDAQSVADEDNIQGAHFCGKNGGTMGVCLLGNYNTAKPSSEMRRSLTNLLSWKLHKEELSTLDAYPHPDGLGDDLPTVTMHRTGCATECPGNNTALLIDSIRMDVQNQIDACNGITAVSEPTIEYKQLIYPNPSDGRFYVMIEDEAQVSSYRIVSMEGKELINNAFPAGGRINTTLPNGQYIIELFADDNRISTKRIQIFKP